MKWSTITVGAALTTMVALLFLMVSYAQAGDRGRSWIVNEDGETVGYAEHEPYIDGSGRTYIRDRDGDLRAVIQESGKYEHREDVAPNPSERQPRKRWGSHEDRWGE